MKHLVAMALILTAPLCFASNGSEQKNSSGVYWVPVGQQLAQFALFNLPKVSVETKEDKVKVEYEIPQELTGAPNKIQFEGPNVESGPVVLTGNYGKMECTGPGDFSNCAVSYNGLNFNAEARTALLQSISKNGEELRKRQLVAARFQFGGEPHGFLRVFAQAGTATPY